MTQFLIDIDGNETNIVLKDIGTKWLYIPYDYAVFKYAGQICEVIQKQGICGDGDYDYLVRFNDGCLESVFNDDLEDVKQIINKVET